MLASILEYGCQAIVYALLAAAMVELLLYAWKVRDPALAIAARLLILAIPPVAPLAFAVIDPGRGSGAFRQQVALLDLHNWFGPDPTVSQPVWAVLLAIAGATTALLVVLDVAGFLRRVEAGHPHGHPWTLQPPPRLSNAVSRLATRGVSVPPVQVAPYPGPTAFAAGMRRPSILVSPAMVDLLDDEELEAALAHEVAHVMRQDNWLGWLTFALRAISFYNPVIQFTYHRLGHDVEKVCDGEAGRITGKPLALASALIKVFSSSRSASNGGGLWGRQVSRRVAALEDKARRTLVEDRVERLVYPETLWTTSYGRLRLTLTAASVVALSYLVV